LLCAGEDVEAVRNEEESSAYDLRGETLPLFGEYVTYRIPFNTFSKITQNKLSNSPVSLDVIREAILALRLSLACEPAQGEEVVLQIDCISFYSD